MKENNVYATSIASDETVTSNEAGTATNQHNDEHQTKRRFSVLDIWSIRRGARVYRIHNRIPRI